MEKKQTIRCNVEGCKYINDDATYCTLDEIQVDSIDDDTNEKDETFCDSYDSKESDDEDDNE